MRLSTFRRWLVVSVPIVMTVWAWVMVPTMHRPKSPKSRAADHAAATKSAAPDGPGLYAKHCAVCHGDYGNGVGIALVDPPARNFGEGKFRLGTTTNAVPSDDDLRRIVREGIPGSAMMAFPDLADDEVRVVVDHVRRLTRSGLYRTLLAKAEQMGDVDQEQLRTVAEVRTRPNVPLDVPAQFPPATTESLTRGRQVYVTACLSCHGPQGRGDGPQVKELKNDDGTPTRPRDLTVGRFKCGGTPQQLYARVVLGMPGTPMPASNTLKPGESIDVVNYVLSLLPPDVSPTSAPNGRVSQGPTNR
jgi:mono/diheme cytochrome c family protein